jgi:teichuronic acid biosynthesis glycosyltransferase TuaG
MIRNKYKIDIILPVYNSENFLLDTLKSIVCQTYKSWRLIIIDDGSIDNTLVILKNFFDNRKFKNRILILHNKKNKGQSYSRNLGLEKSVSKYVAFIDSDDLWDKNKLEKQIYFMESEDCSFSYTDYKIFKKKNIIITPKNYNYNKFVLNTSIATSTMILKRNIIKNKFSSKINLCEDYLFKCQLLKKYKAYKCPKVYSTYRIRSNSLQNNRFKVLYAVWNINKIYNKMTVFNNLISILSITFFSLKKYGFR